MPAEPVASSSRAVEEPASPQNVAVVFAASHAAGEAAPYAAEESTPTKEAEAPVQAPVTPPQGEVKAFPRLITFLRVPYR